MQRSWRDLSTYALSADGKKVLYKVEKDYFIADAAADKGKGEEGKKKLDLSHMRVRVEPTQEWVEMFNSAWRLERDFFFSPKMNGVDWQAVRASYAKLLPLVGSRSDLNYLIGEMLGELGNSHTYVGGGDEMPEEKRVPTAFLGADFALDTASGRYRLATIFPGDNTRDKYRSPLTAPGVDVHAGRVSAGDRRPGVEGADRSLQPAGGQAGLDPQADRGRQRQRQAPRCDRAAGEE